LPCFLQKSRNGNLELCIWRRNNIPLTATRPKFKIIRKTTWIYGLHSPADADACGAERLFESVLVASGLFARCRIFQATDQISVGIMYSPSIISDDMGMRLSYWHCPVELKQAARPARRLLIVCCRKGFQRPKP
jgi:hypothetical protein